MESKRIAKGYKIEDSGDPEAPFELVAPDGRTVTITDSRQEAREISHDDLRERKLYGE